MRHRYKVAAGMQWTGGIDPVEIKKRLAQSIRKELVNKSMRAVKPIEYRTGTVNDDFIRNMLTTVAQTFGIKVPRIFGLNYKRKIKHANRYRYTVQE